MVGRGRVESGFTKKWIKVLYKKGNISYEMYKQILNELKKEKKAD